MPTALRIERHDRVMTLTLDRPERKNPLTFELYADLHRLFLTLRDDDDTRVVIIRGAGENFCSGGDVHEIIGPLTTSTPNEQLAFTQLTGNLVKAMRACPQPILASIDGVCAGAGAILAMASDLRYLSTRASVAFLFVRVGLAGCDMGACAMLPRIIGLGRASELLFTGDALDAPRALAWGFANAVVEPEFLHKHVAAVARRFADGPTRAHAATKLALHREISMDFDSAIDLEAKMQAELMQSKDFAIAYEAFSRKQTPIFTGE